MIQILKKENEDKRQFSKKIKKNQKRSKNIKNILFLFNIFAICSVLTFSLICTVISLHSPVYANDDMSVKYIGDAKKLVSTTNDFFSSFTNVLPGDEYEDYAFLENTSNKDIRLFFKNEVLDESNYKLKEDKDLLDQIKLTIYIDETNSANISSNSNASKNADKLIIYEGNLKAESINDNWINLGVYHPNESTKFKFKISVPADLTNEYDMTNTKVKWWFGVGEIDSSKPVKTGDDTISEYYIVLIILSIIVIYLLLNKYLKKLAHKKKSKK